MRFIKIPLSFLFQFLVTVHLKFIEMNLHNLQMFNSRR